ncbi:MAG: polysaccharide biosynthesis protein [Candidatus Pacebacteria bacterium]|jgi:FlaA1/EpsC-like NDP-sugar epimerase|nr:polysaccharide biosynthesis protein [Candidatus Paceibacterota bacterium]
MGIINVLAKNKKIFFFVCDAILIALSVWLAFMVRFEAQIPGQYYQNILRLVVLGWIFYLPSFVANRLYSFSWSYVSTQELIGITRATGIALLSQIALLFVFKNFSLFSGFPRSTIFIAAFFIFVFCGALRFAKRIYLYLFKPKTSEGRSRILIVGAGDTGEQLLRSIIGATSSHYHPVGFVDPLESRQGSIIHDIKVLGRLEDIPKVVSGYGVEEIIITLASGSKLIKEAVRLGKKAGISKIKIVPPMAEIMNGNVTLANVRRVEVEDLLERDQVSLDTAMIGGFIRGKTVMITGAAGSIGSELCRQVAKFDPEKLVVLDQDETGVFNMENELKKFFPGLSVAPMVADIQNRGRIFEIFREYKPQIVFHAAAYKHVPLMEANSGEAVRNNIFGTKNVGEAAIEHGARNFIFISTDKAINPTSVMGATKRIGEMVCQYLNGKGETRFVSVRFGNVLGSRGSVIPIFRAQIKRGGPVEVTHPEMKRYFMLTSEACLLVMQAGAMGAGGEVFVLDMGQPIKILDLAKEMIKLSGFEPDKDIPIVYIGIRPGEKLFEELLTAQENARATSSNKIFVARLAEVDSSSLERELERMVKGPAAADNEACYKESLKRLVPNY